MGLGVLRFWGLGFRDLKGGFDFLRVGFRGVWGFGFRGPAYSKVLYSDTKCLGMCLGVRIP